MKRSFIVTAGGIGKRMGTEIPKQFLLLGGKPLLMHTIERLHQFDKVAEIIVTLPESHIDYWKELAHKYDFQTIHTVVEGGDERFYSIQNALPYCNGESIAVHDAVRPFVSTETLQRLFTAVQEHPAVVPVIPVRESLRMQINEESKSVHRSDYFLVQTPQVFKRRILLDAYNQDFSEHFTDDASVVEHLGYSVVTVEGNEENIKITTPMDLMLATTLSGIHK